MMNHLGAILAWLVYALFGFLLMVFWSFLMFSYGLNSNDKNFFLWVSVLELAVVIHAFIVCLSSSLVFDFETPSLALKRHWTFVGTLVFILVGFAVTVPILVEISSLSLVWIVAAVVAVNGILLFSLRLKGFRVTGKQCAVFPKITKIGSRKHFFVVTLIVVFWNVIAF